MSLLPSVEMLRAAQLSPLPVANPEDPNELPNAKLLFHDCGGAWPADVLTTAGGAVGVRAPRIFSATFPSRE